MKNTNKFWLEDISQLFYIPFVNITIEQTFNSISRFIIIIFIILFIFNNKYNFLFLFFSLLLIINIYYIQRNTMQEQYQMNLNTQSSNRLCNKNTQFNHTPSYMSHNQKLVGNPNPKTLIQPVVTPPISDLEYWKNNNVTIHSAINEPSQIDVYRSGYYVDNECSNEDNVEYSLCNSINNSNNFCTSNIKQNNCDSNNSLREENMSFPYQKEENENVKENMSFPYQKEENENVKENMSFPYQKQKIRDEYNLDHINSICGYNQTQSDKYNLPSNFKTTSCHNNENLKEYNRNLFTQNIQEDIFTQNDINEPINSNIGISFNQQFNPTTFVQDKNANIHIRQHDPCTFSELPFEENDTDEIDTTNVYDPRHTGYGTSYRAYTDENTGQTRFYYDDVNAIRMPNYLSRSNIDFANYADSYGPIKQNNNFGNKNHVNIRQLANDSFTNSVIQHRTELSERLMRKRNSEMWQRRMFPISTNGQKSLGSMNCK